MEENCVHHRRHCGEWPTVQADLSGNAPGSSELGNKLPSHVHMSTYPHVYMSICLYVDTFRAEDLRNRRIQVSPSIVSS